ncbi:MAG: type II toxin-antitoxin system VapC family toxin [Planctomycetes bacterium]|nr:type II toxin-antitoxin system VapC family toxin [Planctomycetota bacterium]
MKRVFVDSGGFFAHLVSEDRSHAHASEVFATAADESWALVTTNAVVYETHALLTNRAREGREAGLRFLDHIERGLCEVARVTPQDEARATVILRQHHDKGYSFCDALSFVVMGRLGITEAIAFDRHFRAYGQITVL